MSITNSSFLAFLQLQRADYGRALPERLAQIELLWQQALNGDNAVQALATLERCAHSLAGSAATLGFAGVGSAARELELAVALNTDCALSAGPQSEINLAIELLQRSLPEETANWGVQPQA